MGVLLRTLQLRRSGAGASGRVGGVWGEIPGEFRGSAKEGFRQGREILQGGEALGA